MVWGIPTTAFMCWFQRCAVWRGHDLIIFLIWFLCSLLIQTLIFCFVDLVKLLFLICVWFGGNFNAFAERISKCIGTGLIMLVSIHAFVWTYCFSWSNVGATSRSPCFYPKIASLFQTKSTNQLHNPDSFTSSLAFSFNNLQHFNTYIGCFVKLVLVSIAALIFTDWYFYWTICLHTQEKI